MDWITLGMLVTTVVVGGMTGLFYFGDSRKRTQARFDAAIAAEKKATGEWLPAANVEVE